jgi:demethylmenaquinone methyltransferase/2-methoxy-6-polyprenyl-1,4-benzoquinol methylase
MNKAVPEPLPVQAPHAPLTDYYAGAAEKGAFVRDLFDRTAGDYDRIERILALGTGAWYRGKALERAGLAAGMRVLDVGVGTGLVAREAARIAGRPELVTGVDPSVGMMDQAQLPAGLQLVPGVAEALPFADASFDFLSMGYALRHISDLGVAFREFHRVLRPGGRILLLELSAPTGRTGRWLMRQYIRTLVPALAFFVGGQKDTRRLWRYYWDTIDACAPPPRVAATLEAAGFSGVRVHNDLRGISIFSEYQGSKPR